MNWSAGAFTAEVPPGVVTVTSTGPATPAGETAVMELEVLFESPVAATAPNCTAVAPVRLVPVMVTGLPPVVGPEVGLTPVTVGVGGVV